MYLFNWYFSAIQRWKSAVGPHEQNEKKKEIALHL